MTHKFVETKGGVFLIYDFPTSCGHLYKTINGVNWAGLGRFNDPMGNEIEKKELENKDLRKIKDWVLIEREKFEELLNYYPAELVKELKARFGIE